MGNTDNLLIYLSGVTIYVLVLRSLSKRNRPITIERRYSDKSKSSSYIAGLLQTADIVEDTPISVDQSPKSPVLKKYTEPRSDEQLFVGLTPISNSIIATEPILQKIGYSTDEGEVIVIGIAGGTGSGKTTLAKAIYESVGSDNVTYISHDAYYKDLAHLSISQREKHNFDHPDSLDTTLMVEHLGLLKRNMGARIPTYDYTTHTRCEAVEEVFPRPIILIEGILIFADPRLVQLMDIKIYVDTDDDIRLVRRIQRDTVERGRSIQSIITQYMKTVRPMHSQFVEPSKQNADIIVPAGLNSVALDLVVNKLQYIVDNSRLGTRSNSAGSLTKLDKTPN